MFPLISLLLLMAIAPIWSYVLPQSCGYQSCHPVKKGSINVHIVPHTHDDVGWLKTVDQYYYGSKTNIQRAGVRYILDSVVDALDKDSSRRFIYVETAFFWKWWKNLDNVNVRSQVRKLVNNGQLEFISGGWSMNDEAVTNYQSIIDQMAWGLRKLNDTFGDCARPKMGWQIDPFGHSKEMASIFAQLGFDGLLLGRIDFQDKQHRLKTKTPEMVWRSSANLGNTSDIFTGVMYNRYGPPRGFCFDILCSDEPIIDDKDSPEYNVNERIDDFFDYLDNIVDVYTTNNIIITMGNDFNYQDANVWFKNLDKLILYANERQANGSKYNLIYSTPSCYVKAVHDASSSGPGWSIKQDDFFPYASDSHAFWAGYFTSRPTIKRFERVGNNFLQICKQLSSLSTLDAADHSNLDPLREAMGVMQHHDAITGTEKQHVANDYARILDEGIKDCSDITAKALSKLVAPAEEVSTNNEPVIPFTSCPLLNMSQCEPTETQEAFVVTIYNPLSKEVTTFVRLPVTNMSYSVQDSTGQELQTEIVPVPEPVKKIPGRISKANFELIFQAIDVPALGFKSYFVQKTGSYKEVSQLQSANARINLTTGLLMSVMMNYRVLDLSQEFWFYEGFVGDNSELRTRSSGAYIFRPTGNAQKSADKAKFEYYGGHIVAEVHQVFNKWVSQVIKLYANQTFVEFDWLIGPIPNDKHGKEIVTRYSSVIKSNSTFYTDSNGREMLKRVRNFRPTWQLQLDEPIAGNYYPVTSKIVLKDSDVEMAVLTDRAQGGTSLRDGQIELMLHRTCMHDDALGVGEALNEEAFDKGLVVRGSHYLIVGNANDRNPDGRTTAAQERDLANQKLLSAWTFISPTKGLTFDQYKSKYKMEYAGLKRNLPENVKILTLEPWRGSTFLLRLEHTLEINEDPNLSKNISVDLKGLFTPFEITSVQETTLGANQWLKDNTRLHFKTSQSFLLNNLASSTESEESLKDTEEPEDNVDNLVISLKPMQIRTFVLDIKKN